jgi:tetratricopeptide (TPR) repeat protein
MNAKQFLLFNLLFVLSIFNVSAQSTIINTDSVDYCKSGNEFIANYQFDRAIETLIQCFADDLQNTEYLKKIAMCYSNIGQLKDAKNAYLKILEVDSANIAALNLIGLIYIKEYAYNEALKQYEKLVNIDSTNSYYYKKVAELTLKTHDFTGALLNYEKAYHLNSKDIEVITELTKLYQELKLHNKADSLIKTGRSLDSTNVKLMLYQAKSAYEQKDYRAVINGVNQILETSKDTTVYLLKLLGISYFHVKDYNNATKILEKVIKSSQESEVIHYYLGLAFKALGELGRSVMHFELSIQHGISNNISAYYTNLAVTYEEQGKFGESIKAYQAAYKSSKDKILLYHLARNYDSYYQDKKTALRYYEMYLAANDTGSVEIKDYSKHRISELKQIIHFDIDTLD